MGKDGKEDTLRVSATLENIKKSYGAISQFYGLLEGIFEKGLREQGLEFLSVKEGEIILEVGIGTGFSLQEIAGSLRAAGRAYGIDITPQMIKLTEARLRKAKLTDRVALCAGDARTMPYANGVFDAAYMAATLELFDTPDIPRVLGEIKMVLKSSGRLGVASLCREGKENFWFIKLYEWLHQKFPRYASCRPIYVAQTIEDAGFDIVKQQELMIMKLMPMKLVIARPR